MVLPINGILTTKLFIPPHPPQAVPRPRLIERLNEGLCQSQEYGSKLTLISAPAGFGKTTLASEWAAGCSRPVAWLSLGEGDSNPERFLTYLVAALRTVVPGIGEEMLRALQYPQPLAVEVLLTALLNELATLPEGFVLVLDDYHVIDAKSIDEAITFMIEHLPPQMRLVITTREDPRLPLARLRARGQLIELRASDLRFTPSEAAGFLQAMSLNLSPGDIAALEARTEGWIAGLQLAALALQGQLSMPDHPDISGFIRAFAGDHRYIVDYLVEEVLQRQPEPVRGFLLQTSILERLSGPLCDATVETLNRSNDSTFQRSNEILEYLERANLFIIPLDNKRHWYRYHHLFGEVLFARLLAEQPDQVPELHRRASKWYEQHGPASDAIRHALAGQDFERAADLIELAMPEMRRSKQEATLLGWLQALPDRLVHCRPVLSVHFAGALLSSGELKGVEDHLLDAERWLDPPAGRGERPEAPAAERVIVDEAEFRRLPGWIAIYRAACALTEGDVPGTLQYAHRALDLVPEDDNLGRGAAAGFLGLASWRRGELEAAHRSYSECMAWMLRAGHISDAIGSAFALADIRIGQGRLGEAMSTYERGLQLATEKGGLARRGVTDMHVGMSELLRERNELQAAMQHLMRSQELGEHMGSPHNRHRWPVAMARIRQAEGDLDGALNLLREAERLYVSDFFPNVRPLHAMKARVWVAQGRLAEALDWARGQGLSAHDDLSYLREFENITLARLLLALYQRDRAAFMIVEAMELLGRLLKEAEEGGRTGSAIEILVLQALAYQMTGDLSPDSAAALAPLERALRLAEPEGYVQVFIGEGQPMAILLEKAVLQGIASNYASQLLKAFGTAEDRTPVKQALIEPEVRPAKDRLAVKDMPVEPLSERELEVLRLLGTDLNGPEIARELMVSLNTLRTHTKNIYTKLGVNNRLAAIHRAEELNLS